MKSRTPRQLRTATNATIVRMTAPANRLCSPDAADERTGGALPTTLGRGEVASAPANFAFTSSAVRARSTTVWTDEPSFSNDQRLSNRCANAASVLSATPRTAAASSKSNCLSRTTARL